MSAASTEEEAVTVGTAPLTPGADEYITVQLFQDGMRAGLEGMAQTTAAHLGKLEQRAAALEERVKALHCTQPPAGSQITSMTGFTRFLQGFH